MAQQTLHDFVLGLLTDPQAMDAFQLDPDGTLEQAGLADITPQDVQEAIPLVIDYTDGNMTGGLTGSVEGGFTAGLDGLAGTGSIGTPAGDLAAGGAIMHQDGGVAGALGASSPFGSVMAGASPAGFTTAAAGDFSALSDLGDSLDSDRFDVFGDMFGADPTAALIEAIGTGAELTAGGLTGGANSAASLLTAGAGATAGLVGTGAKFMISAAEDPAAAVGPHAVLDGVQAVNVPAGAVPQPATIPVMKDAQPDELVHNVFGQVPAGSAPTELIDPMGTVEAVHSDVLDGMSDSMSDLQAPTGDVLDQGLLTDVVGQSPVSDVVSLGQPGEVTDVVRDVVSLDDALHF